MSKREFHLFLFYCIQGLAFCFLMWGIKVLMPVIIDTLLEGMVQWNNASKIYCWIIQIFFLRISFSLRGYLFNIVKHLVDVTPTFIRYLWIFGGFFPLFLSAWLIITPIDDLNFWVVGEVLLLLLQVYYWVGMAAPMGRVVKVNHQ